MGLLIETTLLELKSVLDRLFFLFRFVSGTVCVNWVVPIIYEKKWILRKILDRPNLKCYQFQPLLRNIWRYIVIYGAIIFFCIISYGQDKTG